VPSFSEAFRFWLKLGLISFGGPSGQIAIMQHELVDQRRWIGQEAFLQALNFCMLLPGPEAQQLATYIGWKLHGIKGALTAGILFVLPGALILYGLAWIAAEHGDTRIVSAVFTGLKPVVVAIVFYALWKVARRVLTTGRATVLAVAAFAALELFSVPFPLVVLAAGVIGWLISRNDAAAAHTAQEAPHAELRTAGRILRMIAIYAVMLIVPVGIVIAFAGTDPFLALARFFTQAAFVTFGGAYAVLPYVADQAVNQFQWLSPDEMINGLALAETTPGPLILVLQYVGFFAGWNAGAGTSPLLAATLGAAVTTYATFLPSIFMIVTGAPYIERIARIKGAAAALAAISAAVVGVIATLGVFFAREVVFGGGTADIEAVIVIAVTLAVLMRFTLGLHWVVLAGALYGLVRLAF
jgi:chromate transporter